MESFSFKESIKMLRSTSTEIYEDGFQWLHPKVDECLNELLILLRLEENNMIRSRLIELIGYSDSLDVIPILEEELRHEDKDVRSWAYSSLVNLDHSSAQVIASIYKDANPTEPFL